MILVNDGLATGASVRAAVQTFAPAPPGTGRPGAPIGAGIDLPGMSVEADDIVCATRRRRSRPAAHRIETAPSRATARCWTCTRRPSRGANRFVSICLTGSPCRPAPSADRWPQPGMLVAAAAIIGPDSFGPGVEG